MPDGKPEASKMGEEQKFAQKQASKARTLEAKAQVARMQELREKAPSAIARGSPQDNQVRQEAMWNEQQRIVSENVQNIATSGGAFQSARADALRSGKFDYGSVKSSYYSPPTEFINTKGERVTRPSISAGPEKMRQVTVTRTTELPKTGTAPRDLSLLARTTKAREQITVTRPQTTEKEATSHAPLTDQQKETLSIALTRQAIKEPIGSRLLKKASGFILPNDYSVYSGRVDPLLISDIVNLLPIGFGGAAAKEVSTIGSITAEKIAAKGTADIGLGISKGERIIPQKENIIRDFNRDVVAIGTKQPTRGQVAKANRIVEAQILKERSFKTATINLGRGPGKVISKGGKGTSTTGTKPPTTPTETTFKEVQVGKGTKQIIRVKQETKTKPKQQIQETIQKQKEETKPVNKQVEEVVPKPPGLKEKPKFIVPRIPLREKSKEKPVPIIPLIPPIEKPKQKLGGGYPSPTALLIPKILLTPPPPKVPPPTRPPPTQPPPPKVPPPTRPPPTETPPPKRPPPELAKVVSPSVRGKASGSKKTFLGNVPTTDIVGMFKGEEITYSPKVIKQRESFKTSREKKIRIL